MRRLRLLLGSCVVLALAAVAWTGAAAGAAPGVCAGGEIAAGTYAGLSVYGNCTFAAGSVRIDGNLIVGPGAVLNDHAASPATVVVNGNAIVQQGGVLGLGTYANPTSHQTAVVNGNVIANGAASLYLSDATVRGNVIVTGGGDPGRNLPIKDDTINGNVVIQGWTGLWFGVVRDTVGGNVILANNRASDTSQEPGSDSTEVVTNTISGNLVCTGNAPAAQIGDSGGTPNTVSGKKIGECAGL
ncbi:MAG TPA: hypothetical protein VF186_03960 [Gaiellaceae bacterium]|jgi:hypothetical protein